MNRETRLEAGLPALAWVLCESPSEWPHYACRACVTSTLHLPLTELSLSLPLSLSLLPWIRACLLSNIIYVHNTGPLAPVS